LVGIAHEREAGLLRPQQQARRNMPADRVARRCIEASDGASLDQRNARFRLTSAWDKIVPEERMRASGHSCAQSSLEG
jgi:hypothetical protein